MKVYVIKSKQTKEYQTVVIDFIPDIRQSDIFIDYEVALAYCPSDCEVVECELMEKTELADLEAKLAEKDEQLEYFSKRDDEQEKQLEKQALFHRKSIKELQNQKALEQLEKVKSAFGLINPKLDKVETIKEYIHYIDHQINELKEMN